MKKFLVFALVLFSACVVFATPLATGSKLKITLNNDDKYDVAWAEEKMNLDWVADKIIDNPDTVGKSFGDSADSSIVVYPSVRTNSSVPIKLVVGGTCLKSGKVKTKINISAQGDKTDVSASILWNGSNDESKVITWTESEKVVTGRRVISNSLTLTMEKSSYEAALADNEYEATLTLTVEPASV